MMNDASARLDFTRKTISKDIPRFHAHNPLRSTFSFRQDPVRFLSELVSHYGDIVHFNLLTIPLIVINHPEYIKRILLDNYANYDRDVLLYRIVKPVLRNGLLTNIGGESWLRQRRLIQPAFHRQRIAGLGTLITDITIGMLKGWEESMNQDHIVDIADEMGYLTLQIVMKSFFSADADDETKILKDAFITSRNILGDFARFPFPPLNVPTPSHLRLKSAIRTMDRVLSVIIQQHIQQMGDMGDVLSMLLQTVDDGTGQGMSMQQLHEEILNLMIGAYDTTSNALTFACYLLSQRAEVEQKLHEELDRVLAGRIPTVDDFPRLPYLKMVIDETLRMYPPGWQAMRRARENDEIGGYFIPANATVFWNLYTLHRHPEFWQDAEIFDPERFSPENVAKRPRYAYMPFAYGPRMCIGNTLALTEIHLALATMVQRYRFVSIPGYHMRPAAVITLRPENGLPMKLAPR